MKHKPGAISFANSISIEIESKKDEKFTVLLIEPELNHFSIYEMLNPAPDRDILIQ